MISANGCAETSNRAAAFMPIGVRDKTELERREPIEKLPAKVVANIGYFRDKPNDLLDYCAFGERTVELHYDLGTPAEGQTPVVVMVPGAEWAELIAMRDRIRGLAGQFSNGAAVRSAG